MELGGSSSKLSSVSLSYFETLDLLLVSEPLLPGCSTGHQETWPSHLGVRDKVNAWPWACRLVHRWQGCDLCGTC